MFGRFAKNSVLGFLEMNTKRKLILRIKRVRGLRLVFRSLLRFKIFLSRSARYLSEGVHWLVASRETTNTTGDLTNESERFLAATVSIVTGTSTVAVIGYFEELKTNEALVEHYQTQLLDHPDGFATDPVPRFGRRLAWYALTRILKPRVVIETGVDKGLGSLVVAAALLKNESEGNVGQHFGTDINPHAGFLIGGAYARLAQVLVGDSIESLNAFDGMVDLFISDSDHDPRYEYNEYVTIAPKLSDRAIVVSDQGTRSLMDFSDKERRKFFFFHDRTTSAWTPSSGIGFSWRSA